MTTKNTLFEGLELNIWGENITTTAKQCKVTADSMQVKANSQRVISNSVNYDYLQPESSDKNELLKSSLTDEELEQNINIAEDGSSKIADIKEGLNVLPVVPKWRKNTPNMDENANDIDKLAIINRVKYPTRINILQELLDYYKDEEDSNKNLDDKDRFDTNSWSKLFLQTQDLGKSYFTNRLNVIETYIDSLNNENHNMIASKYDDVRITNNIAITRAGLLQCKAGLESDISSFSYKTDWIKSLISNDLMLESAANLRKGYLYVFLKHSCGDIKLFREYEILSDNDNYSFCDRTNGSESATQNILIPCCYINKQKQVEPVDVWVLFSSNKLSEARVGKLCTDEKLQAKHLRKLDSKKLSQTYIDYTSGKSYQKGLENTGYNAEPLYEQSKWANIDIYPLAESKTKTTDFNLLVDDPMGMVFENSEYINSVKSLILDCLDNIEKDVSLKSAILAYQIYFNPKAMGLMKVDGCTDIATEYIKGKLKDTDLYKAFVDDSWDAQADRYEEIVENGQSKLDEKKFKKTLKYHYRLLLKDLITKAQSNGVRYLEVDSMEYCWQDFFSRELVDYLSAHSESLAYFAPLCSNPHELDMSLEPNILPNDTVSIKPVSIAGINRVSVRSPNLKLITGATVTQYSLDGFSINKKTTIYDDQGRIKSVETVDATSEAKRKLDIPIGFDWLDKYLLSDNGYLNAMFFADDAESDNGKFEYSKLKDDIKAYTKADGSYNREFVGFSSVISAKANDEKSPWGDYKDKFRDKVLSEFDEQLKKNKLIVHIDNAMTGLMSILRMRGQTTYKNVNIKLVHMVSDSFGVARGAIKLSKPDDFENTLLYFDLAKAEGIEISNVKSDAQKTDIRSRYNKQRNLAKNMYENKYKTITIDNSLVAAEYANFGARIGCSGVLVSISAYSFLSDVDGFIKNLTNEEKDKLDVAISLSNMSKSFVEMFTASIEAQNTLNEYLLGKSNQNTGFENYNKSVQITKPRDNSTIQKTKANLKKVDRYVKFAAIGICSMEAIQALLRFNQSLSQTDKRVMASNFFDLLSKGFALAAAVKEVQGLAKGAKAVSVFALKQAVTSTTEVALVETSILRTSLATLARLGFGVSSPGAVVISLIALASSIVSWAILYFRDNVYEGWAKASRFALKDNKKFNNIIDEYASLLSIIASPNVAVVNIEENKKFNIKMDVPQGLSKLSFFDTKVYLIAKTQVYSSFLPYCIRENASGDTHEGVQELNLAYDITPKFDAKYDNETIKSLESDITYDSLKKEVPKMIAATAEVLRQQVRERSEKEVVYELFDENGDDTEFGIYVRVRLQGEIELENEEKHTYYLPNDMVYKVSDAPRNTDDYDVFLNDDINLGRAESFIKLFKGVNTRDKSKLYEAIQLDIDNSFLRIQSKKKLIVYSKGSQKTCNADRLNTVEINARNEYKKINKTEINAQVDYDKLFGKNSDESIDKYSQNKNAGQQIVNPRKYENREDSFFDDIDDKG